MFLTFSVSSFIKSNRPNFIANNEWSPTSIHWIIRPGGNAGVLLQAVTEAKNSSQVYRCTLVDLVCFLEKAIDNAVLTTSDCTRVFQLIYTSLFRHEDSENKPNNNCYI